MTAVAAAIAAVHVWFPHATPYGGGDVPRSLRIAWSAAEVCTPERREGLFKLYVAWAGRESCCVPIGHEKGRDGNLYAGPMRLNEAEVVAAAVRLKWLTKKPTAAQRAHVWHLYVVDQDVAVIASVCQAAFLLESSRWEVVPGVMRHCGTHPDRIVMLNYMPRLACLYFDTWGTWPPLTLEPDRR